MMTLLLTLLLNVKGRSDVMVQIAVSPDELIIDIVIVIVVKVRIVRNEAIHFSTI